MICVRIQGRLGNQMFQYAFGYALSKKLNTKFYLDETNSSASELKSFFALNNYPKSFYIKLYEVYTKIFNKNKKIIEVSHGDPFSSFKIDKNGFYKGYFQSEYYFQKYIEQVKSEFKIKSAHIISVRNYLNIQNTKPLIAIHVRRTDYIQHGSESLGGENLTLPMAYYKNSLGKIETLEKYNLVFITDDENYVLDNFKNFNPIISSSKSPIIDFQVLLEAEIVIVANSSFSWWGAFLNNKARRIMAPKYWLGFKIKNDYPPNIIPSNWEKIEF